MTEKKKVGLVDAIIRGDVELIDQARRDADPEELAAVELAALMDYSLFWVGEHIFIGQWIIGAQQNPREFHFEKEEGERVGRFSVVKTIEDTFVVFTYDNSKYVTVACRDIEGLRNARDETGSRPRYPKSLIKAIVAKLPN